LIWSEEIKKEKLIKEQKIYIHRISI
jgi:hypothetical protein